MTIYTFCPIFIVSGWNLYLHTNGTPRTDLIDFSDFLIDNILSMRD